MKLNEFRHSTFAQLQMNWTCKNWMAAWKSWPSFLFKLGPYWHSFFMKRSFSQMVASRDNDYFVRKFLHTRLHAEIMIVLWESFFIHDCEPGLWLFYGKKEIFLRYTKNLPHDNEYGSDSFGKTLLSQALEKNPIMRFLVKKDWLRFSVASK